MPNVTGRFALVGLCWLCVTPAFAQSYRFTALGTLGGDYSSAAGINASGQVVGSSTKVAGGMPHPVLWTAGVIRDLGRLPGFEHCEANALNDLAQVVGSCYNPSDGPLEAFFWSASTGLMRLGIPSNFIPLAINNHGDVVGVGLDNRAFLFRDRTFVDLGPGIARGINDSGQIIGHSYALNHAVLWDGTGVHDLGTVSGGVTSFATAISPGGFAVGMSDQGEPGRTVASVFSSGGVGNLGTLGGFLGQATAVRAGIVVGYAMNSSGVIHAFLYDLNGSGVMVDLHTRMALDPSWILRGATGINDSGAITVNGDFNGQAVAVLLTPSQNPVPTTNLLVDPGFEDATPPHLNLPGWIADDFRQVASKSETNQPRSGDNNGACWTTDNLDCGMFQDIPAPTTGTYTLTIYANADRPGALVGANVGDDTAAFSDVAVRGFANYGNAYVLTFEATQGQPIRVWMYSPAVPGYLVIDDVTLTGPGS